MLVSRTPKPPVTIVGQAHVVVQHPTFFSNGAPVVTDARVAESGDAKTYVGTFGEVRDQVIGEIAERDAHQPADYPGAPFSNGHWSYDGEEWGESDAVVIRATDKPDTWRAAKIYLKGHDGDWRIEVDDPQFHGDRIHSTFALTGLGDDARAICDAKSAVNVLDGSASWTIDGRAPRASTWIDTSARKKASLP